LLELVTNCSACCNYGRVTNRSTSNDAETITGDQVVACRVYERIQLDTMSCVHITCLFNRCEALVYLYL
jgi:hypothetical protein